MSNDSAGGMGSRLKGYAKEVVAEIVGDARLQEEGRSDIAEGRRRAAGGDNSAEAPEEANPAAGGVQPMAGPRQTADEEVDETLAGGRDCPDKSQA